MNTLLSRFLNSRGASLVEYALLINIFSLCLFAVAPNIQGGIDQKLARLQSGMHGGGTASTIVNDQGGDLDSYCRNNPLAYGCRANYNEDEN